MPKAMRPMRTAHSAPCARARPEGCGPGTGGMMLNTLMVIDGATTREWGRHQIGTSKALGEHFRSIDIEPSEGWEHCSQLPERALEATAGNDAVGHGLPGHRALAVSRARGAQAEPTHLLGPLSIVVPGGCWTGLRSGCQLCRESGHREVRGCSSMASPKCWPHYLRKRTSTRVHEGTNLARQSRPIFALV
jgi:hypothetical protein